MIKQAVDLRQRFQDKQNKKLVNQVIEAAKQYLDEFNKIVKITNANVLAQDSMASLGRKVEDRSSQLRDDQKQELQRLERISTRSSKQRLDKRIKADTANRIIKLMGEARQQEKNFLLRKEQAYVEQTRTLVNQAVRQAQLLRERFQDKQNRELADKIISAAQSYSQEFEDVVVAENEQVQQQARMVNAAREIEQWAGQIRHKTQLSADNAKETAVVIILLTLALALILGVAAAVILTNSISKPIQELVEVINRLAREDNVDVPLVMNQDEIGKIARAISNFKEVILRRKEKTEAQLIQAEKMAALGDLVAGVAHEINTPIGIAVTGSTHLQDQITLLEQSFDQGKLTKSEFKDFVDNAMPTAATIQNNLERASALIKSFKQVAVDQSSQELRIIKIADYINNVLVSLHPKIKQTKHQILVEGDQQLMIETVPGALSQVITNLVMNSLTHGYETDSESGIIKINIASENKDVIITYSDDGKGMSDETAKRIYEPFFTTKRGTGGSGLGLSIIFNLVTQTLGGVIHCSTKYEQGVSFEIRFPIKKEMDNIND
ncbi:sensor histidine kinase [sulfur-oxidizing endosymbiont of Gigantopelta aegis]|nr:HAMP domain-containing sensor histidine kinase [sulfur-oxidizing endosymbiont of Gigantopelta aegis]